MPNYDNYKILDEKNFFHSKTVLLVFYTYIFILLLNWLWFIRSKYLNSKKGFRSSGINYILYINGLYENTVECIRKFIVYSQQLKKSRILAIFSHLSYENILIQMACMKTCEINSKSDGV